MVIMGHADAMTYVRGHGAHSCAQVRAARDAWDLNTQLEHHHQDPDACGPLTSSKARVDHANAMLWRKFYGTPRTAFPPASVLRQAVQPGACLVFS